MYVGLWLCIVPCSKSAAGKCMHCLVGCDWASVEACRILLKTNTASCFWDQVWICFVDLTHPQVYVYWILSDEWEPRTCMALILIGYIAAMTTWQPWSHPAAGDGDITCYEHWSNSIFGTPKQVQLLVINFQAWGSMRTTLHNCI